MNIVAETLCRVQEDILKRYGVAIGEIEADGHIKRLKATWIVGNVWDFKGKDYCTFRFGNWKFADGTHRIDSFEKKDLKNKAFMKDFQKKMKEIDEKIATEKKEKNAKCIKDWLPKWKKADRDGVHDYLIDKGIEKAFGSRVDFKNVMLIGAYDEFEKFVGVQRIYMNPESEEYEKRFASGIKIKGSIAPLSPFKNAQLVYIVESFSTGSSVQTAFPKASVVCVFSANNILAGIETVRKINPSCKIIIAADRDKESNTGERYARLSCQRVTSCIYKMPIFKNDNGKWTDFNDLHQFNSLKSVQDQLKYKESDFVVIQPLGVKDDRYYYMSSENPQPIKILGHNHTERYLYNLIPSYSWWFKNYPKFDADDEEKENPTGVNWTAAGNDLMAKCINKGIIDFSDVRSSGVWEDNGKYYYHNGFNLYDGRNQVDVFSDRLSKHYVLGKNCHSLKRNNQLSEEERACLVEIFGTISTKTQNQGLLLLGWLATAPVAGALPWRPHVWLTGESSQGKSWVMENILGVILKGFSIRPQGDSTEAGIRQTVGNQALPLIFDEFETDDVRTSGRTEGVIGLARQASTPTGGDIMRGTTQGSAMTFSPNFSMCVSSINVNLSHKQDKNRWTVIEFSSDRAGEEQFEKVQQMVRQLIGHDFGTKLVSYIFHNLDVYIENFNTIDSYLRSKQYKGHFCRQYASLIAGLLLIVTPEAVDRDSLIDFLKQFDLNHYFEQSGEEDPIVFKEAVLANMIKVDNESMTIAEVINRANLGDKGACIFQRALSRYGIKAGTDYFLIKRSANKNFTNLFKDSKWKNNWAIALTRIDGATNYKNKSVWLNGSSSKVIQVPFKRWSLTEGE